MKPPLDYPVPIFSLSLSHALTLPSFPSATGKAFPCGLFPSLLYFTSILRYRNSFCDLENFLGWEAPTKISMLTYAGMGAAQPPAHLQHVCCTEMLRKD